MKKGNKYTLSNSIRQWIVSIVLVFLFQFTFINKVKSQNSKAISKQILVKKFMKKFRVLELPFNFTSSHLKDTISQYEYFDDTTNLLMYNNKDIDTLFFKKIKYFNTHTFYYGLLADTQKFYSFILLEKISVRYQPILVTISKDGELLSSTVIGCSICYFGGPGVSYFNSITTIDKDLSINISDTAIVLDVIKNVTINDTTEVYTYGDKNTMVWFRKGRIEKSGLISLDNEKIDYVEFKSKK